MNICLWLLIVSSTLFYPLRVVSEMNEHADPRTIPITARQPEENKRYPIAIIGAGAAGTMAVQRAVLNNDNVLLFTGSRDTQRSSRGYWVRKVDNIPGCLHYERTILELRNDVLKGLALSPLAHNLFLIEDSVCQIEKIGNCFKLTDSAGRTYDTDYVVLATGIMDEQPSIQGSIRSVLKYANSQTVVYCALCDGHRSFGKKTAVIGHEETAADTALYLFKKYQPAKMTLLTNGQKQAFPPKFSAELQKRQIPVLESPIQEILGDQEHRQLAGFTLENGESVDAEIAFVSLGIRPNNQLALQLGAQVDDRGLVVTNTNHESTVPNLFVIGDLQANTMKQIYTAWQQAVECMLLINCRIIDCQ